MKKFYLISLLAIAGCLSEKDLDIASPSTFVKYYNGGYNDVAHDIKQTSDGGFILLATTEARATEVSAPRYKVKLVKTDEFGNMLWSRVYPEYSTTIDPNTNEPDDVTSFTGRSIEIIKDGSGIETGYVIVGDSLLQNNLNDSYLRIMVTDLDGNITRARNTKPSFPVNGSAVAINASGNFVVLGSAVNAQLTQNMFLAELDPNLSVIWGRAYGAGAAQLTNRLFIDPQASIFWSGTVTKNNRTDIRFVKTPPNSENTEFDLPIGTPANNETGQDICKYGFGFAVIGTTNESGDQDIQFNRLAEDGTVLSSKSFRTPNDENRSENGLSICQARDGGLILLGVVDSNVTEGRGGKDYLLIKIDAFGNEERRKIFGSKNDDVGCKVLSLADGSYVLYGTTVWGGLRTLSLIKTNSFGEIE